MAPPKPEKIRKEFFDALLHNGPITPRHEPPSALAETWAFWVRDEDRQFFEDFRHFAEVLNSWLAKPFAEMRDSWRLQELPKTELRLVSSDDPMFGRRYSIFHNQVGIGTLEVESGFEYSTEKPNIVTRIKLDWVRLLRYDDIVGFLTTMAIHVCRREDRAEWRLAIESAMTKALWQTHHISEFGWLGEDLGELESQFNGIADWYFHQKNGLAGMRRSQARQPS
jgi:hypothetical protein